MVDGQAGYDYLLDPANSIAILASYGKIDYTGTGTPRLERELHDGLYGRPGLRKENHWPPGVPGRRGAAGNYICRASAGPETSILCLLRSTAR